MLSTKQILLTQIELGKLEREKNKIDDKIVDVWKQTIKKEISTKEGTRQMALLYLEIDKIDQKIDSLYTVLYGTSPCPN